MRLRGTTVKMQECKSL